MAIDEGVTEVADSDEELMTSSPFVDVDSAVDKLSAMTSAQPQDLQDAVQEVQHTAQALGQDDANTASQSTTVLGIDRCCASANVNASSIDQTDVKLEGAVALQGQRAASKIIVHAQIANSSMGQPMSLAEQPQSSTDAQTLSSSRCAGDMPSICDSQAHNGRIPAEQGGVMSNSSLHTRLKDVDQNTSQDLEIIYLSENAVHRSQGMGMSNTTRALTATNSLNPTILGLAKSASTSVASKDGIDTHPDPDPNEIRDQELQTNGGDYRPDIESQEPVAKTQEASLSTPQMQMLQEKPKAGNLTVGKTSQLKEAASQCLDTDNTTTKPLKTPQEITLFELKAERASLLASLRSLPAVQALMEEMAASGTGADGGCNEPTDADIMNAANKIVKQHIKLLHEYNELKDVGQGLMGLIADQRGVRIIEVQEEFGVDGKD